MSRPTPLVVAQVGLCRRCGALWQPGADKRTSRLRTLLHARGICTRAQFRALDPSLVEAWRSCGAATLAQLRQAQTWSDERLARELSLSGAIAVTPACPTCGGSGTAPDGQTPEGAAACVRRLAPLP